MNTASDERQPPASPDAARGRFAPMLRDGALIAGAIALFFLLQLVILPRLGFAT